MPSASGKGDKGTYVSPFDLNGYRDSDFATDSHALRCEAQDLKRVSVPCDSKRQSTVVKLTMGAEYRTMPVAIFEAQASSKLCQVPRHISHDSQHGRTFY